MDVFRFDPLFQYYHWKLIDKACFNWEGDLFCQLKYKAWGLGIRFNPVCRGSKRRSTMTASQLLYLVALNDSYCVIDSMMLCPY